MMLRNQLKLKQRMACFLGTAVLVTLAESQTPVNIVQLREYCCRSKLQETGTMK